jgi:flagellar hook-length control protein FliK
MTAPLIQLAPSMSAENIAAGVHAFETSVGAGASFAEHLDHAVQSSPRPVSRPQTQPSESTRTDSQAAKPKQTSDAAPQASRTQVTAVRSSAPQTKQIQNTNGKAQGTAASSAQKDEQRQPASAPSRDSRLSDSSRNSGGRQAGDKETSAKGKGPFAQAVDHSAASQPSASEASAQSGEAQSVDTTSQPADASIPAALLALLQAAQTFAVQPETASGNEPVQTDSSSTDAASATPSNLFQALNFSSSNAAYQAALTNFGTSGTSAQTASAQPASTDTANSASQTATSASSANSLPSSDGQSPVPSADSASTGNATSGQATSGNEQSVPPSATLPQVNAPAGQQAPEASEKLSQIGTAESADLIKNLKLDASQHVAVKPAPEQGLNAAAKTKADPVAAELQQAVTSVTVLTNHSPALSRQASVTDSQPLATGSDSGSPAVSASQGSASGLGDSSTGDADGDDSSTQAGSAPQGSNGSKSSSGGAVEFLPNSAFTSDAVSGVAPAAVHAIAAATLQSNGGFDTASFKTPEAVPQNFNTAAQEKAFAAWQSVSDQVGRVVNTAALNALQNGTEMRVQLRTDAFGPMDIRATLEGGKIGAAIGVESAEAHNALLGQLPALQQSLNERQVQLDQISVVSNYGQSATDLGTGSGKQNGDPTPSGGYRQQASGPEQVSESISALVTEAWQPATSRGRLSVQA